MNDNTTQDNYDDIFSSSIKGKKGKENKPKVEPKPVIQDPEFVPKKSNYLSINTNKYNEDLFRALHFKHKMVEGKELIHEDTLKLAYKLLCKELKFDVKEWKEKYKNDIKA